MRKVRRLVCPLLPAAMLLCMSSAAAENMDLVHRICYAIAEAGQMDMSKAWELKPPGKSM